MSNRSEPMHWNPVPRWFLLVGGILAVILGGILLWAPAKTRADAWLLLVVILGVYWLFTGILEIVSLVQDRRQWGWRLFTGAISILAGGYILLYPVAAAVALPRIIVLVLGIWGIIHGIILISTAFRGGGWGAAILGILLFFLGIILVLHYSTPGIGVILIWTAGAIAFVGGIIMIIQSFRQRSPLYPVA